MSSIRSRVIDHVQSNRNPRTIHLLYYYASYGRHKQYRTMLMTFWEQSSSPDCSISMEAFARSATDDDEIHASLHQHLTDVERDVYVVIDALDQLPTEDHYHLLGWLNSLFQQHQKSGSKSCLAVMVTSRNENGCDELPSNHLSRIHVHPNDISEDLREYLDKRLGSALLSKPENPELKERVKESLISKADGMFLWARLKAAEICTMTLKADVVLALEESPDVDSIADDKSLEIPKKIYEMYKRYAKDFESPAKPLKEQQIVLRIMALLAHTTGSMSTKALYVALAIDTKEGKIDQGIYDNLIRYPNLTIQWCNSLIDINEILGTVSFCHGTVFEFFKTYKPADGQKLVAQLCLAHLCSSDFSEILFDDPTQLSHDKVYDLRVKNPFLKFASCNWAIAAKKSVGKDNERKIKTTHAEILSSFERLLGGCKREGKRVNLQLSFQVYHSATMGKLMPHGVQNEHIVSHFALHEFVNHFVEQRWLGSKWEERDDEGSMAMHWAIGKKTKHDIKDGDTVKMIEQIIRNQGDVDAQDIYGCTPLHYASHYGKLDVVKLLLDEKAKINCRNKMQETPLIVACKSHHEKVIIKLLEAGANSQIQSVSGSALQVVSLRGCSFCATSLFERYEKRNKMLPIFESGGPFGTPLHAAAYCGHSNIVDLLVGGTWTRGNLRLPRKMKRFSVLATNPTYGSVLTAAAIGCTKTKDPAPFKEIFRKLINHGVNVNDPSGEYGPALRAAASNGHLVLVELLWQSGAEIRLSTSVLGTAYQAAKVNNHQDIMFFLLTKDPRAPEARSTERILQIKETSHKYFLRPIQKYFLLN
ncbi:ankyrin repeat-containing domain protein [Phyllosticta capitalensis]|uniref:Ankyrin repeat-containing domain protein n=1 Tax=Phyllosticta capitalensis TaxID=121624 RepID=A0ABR1Z0R8_9PEZI